MEGLPTDAVSQSSQTLKWPLCGQVYPKHEIVFFAQIILLYVVIITSLYNLTRAGENRELWITLLSSSVGYLLPNPQIKKRKP